VQRQDSNRLIAVQEDDDNPIRIRGAQGTPVGVVPLVGLCVLTSALGADSEPGTAGFGRAAGDASHGAVANAREIASAASRIVYEHVASDPGQSLRQISRSHGGRVSLQRASSHAFPAQMFRRMPL
jgi:hypothetical protein